MPISEVKLEKCLVISPIADAFSGKFFLIDHNGEQHKIFINSKGDPAQAAKVSNLLDSVVTVTFNPFAWEVKDKKGIKNYLVRIEEVES